MAKISEEDFRRVCGQFYADLESVHALNPAMRRRDALLWMIYGSLTFLLDVPADYEPSIPPEKSDNIFAAAILDILQDRMNPPFDAANYLSELSRKVTS